MKSLTIKVATLPALALASSLLAFGGDQTAIHKYVPYDPQDVPKAVVQEKGHESGARNEVRAKAYREQTAPEAALLKQDQAKDQHPNYADSAFRK